MNPRKTGWAPMPVVTADQIDWNDITYTPAKRRLKKRPLKEIENDIQKIISKETQNGPDDNNSEAPKIVKRKTKEIEKLKPKYINDCIVKKEEQNEKQ